MSRRSTSTFTVNERRGLWVVSCDGAFYGDYHSQAQAVAGAQLGAQAVEGRGGAACILLQPDARVVTH